ncbi:hypothetical protein [Aquitalea aquatica]|uniref:Uncharacterized protein n=1 Tax=Aquitalea aquatica TaxID=3044273 RepID=A0A838Y2I9_9NEIS|nr:hypothetical protein [Aquitalea magnusonii]MBA4707502.1 hypothetical protein [Aquitalea magnusonii]
MQNDPRIDLDSLLWHKDGLLLEGFSLQEEFWVALSPAAGWVKFKLVSGAQACYLPAEVRPAHEPVPHPLVSLQGVWWLRQAASSEHQAICSYQQVADLISKEIT